jgi:adenosylhomocysteinase
MSIVKDVGLAPLGRRRIQWAGRRMPVLNLIRERYRREKPLRGIRIAACLHVTSETANLISTLKSGGAKIALAGSNPLSTQDDVAAALASQIDVYAFRGESEKEYYECIKKVIEVDPDIVLDDGADLIATLHRRELGKVLGGCEETTTGVARLRSLEREEKLAFPVIAVNDAETKMMFDNRYGTGQSTIHGIMNATNFLFAGRTVVIVGYGWCGRGIASRARGMGASVIIVEVNPRKALEAVMDGYSVMRMGDAAKKGDLFITATGDISVIRKEHFRLMKDGAILANAGHFNVEINIPDLEKIAKKKKIGENLIEYKMKDGRRIYLLAEGRLVNLVSAYGHPPEVMDMSFSNQALSVDYLCKNSSKLEPRVYPVPKEIDEEVARLKLSTMGIRIEKLTREQAKYLSSWEAGT